MFDFLKKLFGGGGGIGLYVADGYLQAAKGGVVAQRVLPVGLVLNGVVKDEKALAKEIGTLWQEAKFEEKEVCLALPEEQVFEQVFFVAAELNGADLERNIDGLIAETIPLTMHEVKRVYNIFASGNAKVVNVMAMKREVLAQYYEAVRLAGLKASCFEPEGGSLLRNVGKDLSGDQAVLVLDERAGKWKWYCVWMGKVFSAGMRAANDAAGLAGDLQAVMKLFGTRSGRQVKEILLCGEASAALQTAVGGLGLAVSVATYKLGDAAGAVVNGAGMQFLAQGERFDLLQK